jgi:hypothetical protein
MKLVKFLRDYGGYTRGSYQWYDEAMADAMARNGLVEIYVKPEDKPIMTEPEKKEPEKKQVKRAPKDKMLRSPGKSK